MKYAAAVG